jgi:hypothetical protein
MIKYTNKILQSDMKNGFCSETFQLSHSAFLKVFVISSHPYLCLERVIDCQNLSNIFVYLNKEILESIWSLER